MDSKLRYIWGTALGLVGAAGLLIFNKYTTMNIQQLVPVSQVQKQKPSLETQVQTSLPQFLGFEDVRYSTYDATILHYTQWVNSVLSEKGIPGFRPLDPVLVKAQIVQETGGLREKDSFDHDPMQIANKGDHGLNELQHSGIYRRLGIVDCSSRFADIVPTSRHKGHWEYGGKNIPAGKRVMDADTSILGGIIFLADKAASSETVTVKTGSPFVHIVNPKETLWGVAQKEKSTLAVMQEMNPGIDAKKMRPGMSVIVQRAHEEPHITRIDWYQGLQNYNGKGTARYADAVMSIRHSEVRE